MRHVLYPALQLAAMYGTFVVLGDLAEASGLLDLLAIEKTRVVLLLSVIGVLGALSSWVLAKSVAIWSVRARPLEAADRERPAGDVEAAVLRLAPRFGLRRPPELSVYASDEVNAFAVGGLRSRSLLCVSTALLERAEPSEAEAILAQELARLASGDASVLLFMHGLLNVFTIFPARMLAFIFGTSLRTFEEETPSDGVELGTMAVLEALLVGVPALLARRYSRTAEQRADARAAAVLGGDTLRRAVERLEQEGARRVTPREVFIWPFKFGADPAVSRRWLAYHQPPALRLAALR